MTNQPPTASPSDFPQDGAGQTPPVQITFDCLPLRSLARRDVPLDASPKYQAFCHRVLAALDQHGSFNSYYLHNARCLFRLLNDPKRGQLEFRFEGTVLTDEADRHARQADLTVQLERETCDWLTAPVVQWFRETVCQAVLTEFDRYIAAGDLAKTVQRLETLQKDMEEGGGFVGMYL